MTGGGAAGAARPASDPGAPIAVVDIGSNSLRMTIARPRAGGCLEVVAEPRAALRLARSVDAEGGLSPAAIARTLAVLDDFMALAARHGAARVEAVGTSALRDAGNAAELARAIRERWGVGLEVLDAEAEGRVAALGAIYGLPVEDGLVVDLGGGSLQVVRFRGREVDGVWSFRLGALRLADRFGLSGTPAGLEALRRHVRGELGGAGAPRLGQGETLVATGGTARNLAALSRRARRRYPVARVHGHALTSRRLRRVRDRLAAMPEEQRRRTPGLNRDRADIIVAGAGALLAVMGQLRAHSMLVSGQGLREGVARGAGPLPAPPAVRRASVDALARRFASWDEARARRRAAIAAALAGLLDPDADAARRETLEHAALLFDAGSAIDAYRRERATAQIVLRADLGGFGHADVARLAAAVRVAHRPEIGSRALRPLLGPGDEDGLQRAGALLALADELEQRLPPGVPPRARLRLDAGALRAALPGRGWRPEALAARIRRVFGVGLEIAEGEG